MKKSIFRMYDVRGIADTELNDDDVYLIGRAFGTYIKRRGGKRVASGMDVRLSSGRIKSAFNRGVVDTGINVIDVGVVTTPMLYFSEHFFKCDGGIMVTGSHNPIEYNGLKMVDPDITIYGDTITSFYEMIMKNDFEKGSGAVENKTIDSEYIKMCCDKIKISSKMRILVDPGNGTAGPIAEEIFKILGVQADFINKERDGRFPNHLPDPTVMEFTVELREKTKSLGYDCGIGYDGDCDRIGLIDENGEMVFGDQILGILAKDMLSRNKGEKVIFDVKCSQGLEEIILKEGGKPIMHKTGHSLLKRKMKEENALLAGEMSGHMFFNEDFFGFDDGLFASLLVLRILSERKIKLSELKKEMPYYISTPEIRVDTTEEDKFNIVDEIVGHYKKEGYRVIDIDGARVYFDGGWALVRASNTQPILVVRFEAKTKEQMDAIRSDVRDVLASHRNVDIKNV
ncbi:MAG: phosphomannomutase/phosphoglucomutase [bacterium]|nr:phosphomannomutase/phosphoglucomutase [bacterium]